jgi:hypothetical protein
MRITMATFPITEIPGFQVVQQSLPTHGIRQRHPDKRPRPVEGSGNGTIPVPQQSESTLEAGLANVGGKCRNQYSGYRALYAFFLGRTGAVGPVHLQRFIPYSITAERQSGRAAERQSGRAMFAVERHFCRTFGVARSSAIFVAWTSFFGNSEALPASNVQFLVWWYDQARLGPQPQGRKSRGQLL